jgi:uncharacterized protein (UPF0264 family)
MRLLVSVRDAHEAHAALAGGADIIDAKEPALGPLAPVEPETLRAICAVVPPAVALSVALGDAIPSALAATVAAVEPLGERCLLFFKAAVVSPGADAAATGITAACRLLERRCDRAALIVARYVDEPADAEDLSQWIAVSARAGARGVLLDTSRKHGPGLFGSVGPRELAALRREATRRGIWLALAGGITLANLAQVAAVRPHVLGVRGAVCEGTRTDALSAARVVQLREALARFSRSQGPRALPV